MHVLLNNFFKLHLAVQTVIKAHEGLAQPFQEFLHIPNLIVLVDGVVVSPLPCPVNIKILMSQQIVIEIANEVPRVLQSVGGQIVHLVRG
jgi:hypothetical protein